eukprot:470550-Hanusia_phi.AAC.11
MIPIPRVSLFPKTSIADLPRWITVVPNLPTDTSTVHGIGLTIATSGITSSFRVILRDAYNNVRWGFDDKAVARLWSTSCFTTALAGTCQDLFPSVLYKNFPTMDLLNGVASAPFLNSDVVNITQSETCNLRSFLLPIPPHWNVSITEQQVFVMFESGACNGRWTKVFSTNTTCLRLNETLWDDGLGPCIEDGSLSFQLSIAPWARPAFPPLGCKTCPRLVRSQYLPSAEEGTYNVFYTPTRKGQYSVVTSIVGEFGLFATYYSMDVNSMIYPVKSSMWDKGTENEFAVDWSSNPSITSPGLYAVNYFLSFSSPGLHRIWSSLLQLPLQRYLLSISTSLSRSSLAPLNLHIPWCKDNVHFAAPLASAPTTFAMRWTGFLNVEAAAEQILQLQLGGGSSRGTTQERVKMWVDNSIIIDQWASLQVNHGLTGLGIAGGYYDISILYKCTDISMGCGLSLRSGTVSARRIAGSQLSPVLRGGRSFEVSLPLLTPRHISYAFGVQLTIATAGSEASFLILARDAYENVNDHFTSEFKVVLEGQGQEDPNVQLSDRAAGAEPVYQTRVKLFQESQGLYSVQFTAYEAKSYTVKTCLTMLEPLDEVGRFAIRVTRDFLPPLDNLYLLSENDIALAKQGTLPTSHALLSPDGNVTPLPLSLRMFDLLVERDSPRRVLPALLPLELRRDYALPGILGNSKTSFFLNSS